MSEAFLHIADVARAEIRRGRRRTGVEHRHPRFALEVVLPFIGVRMPVQLAHAARLDRDQGGSGCRRYIEIAAVDDLDGPAFVLPVRCLLAKRPYVRMGW